jgi:uncharacterized protein (TIRG00374 family)
VFRPKVIVSTVVGLALIGALIGVSDIGKVGAIMSSLKPEAALAFVVLMLVYEAIRWVQWHVLLRALRIRAPLAAEAFSFLLGEATKSAPIGNYFQDYLLARTGRQNFARTSATTTLIVLTEVGLCLATVVAIGIDGWTWLRQLIVIGLAVFACVAAVLYRLYGHVELPSWVNRHPWLRTALDQLDRFRHGVRDLLTPRTLATESLLGAAYLATAGLAFYIAALGLGISDVSFWQLLAVYAFSLAAGLILPLPIDLGVFEVGGLGALVAYGVSKEVALSLMLVNRLLSVGSALLVGGIATLVLHDELQQALDDRRASQVARS